MYSLLDRVRQLAEEQAAIGWRDLPSQSVRKADGRNAVAEMILDVLDSLTKIGWPPLVSNSASAPTFSVPTAGPAKRP